MPYLVIIFNGYIECGTFLGFMKRSKTISIFKSSCTIDSNNSRPVYVLETFSTNASIELIKHIFEAWEKLQNTLRIFCDLFKASVCAHYVIQEHTPLWY